MNNSKKIGQQLNNSMYGRSGRKANFERSKRPAGNPEDIAKIPAVKSCQVGIPQDVDTKVALHSIEEQGMSAIGNLLDQSILPECPDIDSSNCQCCRNSTIYDDIKWEDNETKQNVKDWKFCPVCGTRITKPRLKRNLKTCSKACTDVLMNEITNNT